MRMARPVMVRLHVLCMVATWLLVLTSTRTTSAWNAASVWGIVPNHTYHPDIANVIFESGLAEIDHIHRSTGATGL